MNEYKFPDWVAMESMRRLTNKSQVIQFFNTDYNKEFTKEFAVGERVSVKFPQRFLVTDGLDYQGQPIDRRSTDVYCNQIFGVHFDWDSFEAALKQERGKEQITKEYINPAMDQLASELDSRATLHATLNTPNVVGVLGTTPTSMSPFSAARTRLNENSCPKGARGMIITPEMTEKAIGATIANFNPASEISRQYREGSIGKYANFDFYESNQLYAQTAGTWAGAVTVTSANQSGSQILITATAGDTFKRGDRFSVALMNNVNPSTRRSVGRLKNFVVTQDMTAAGGGADVLNIYPSIEGPGSQYQNVDSLPGAGAALTLWPGTGSPNGKSGIVGLALCDQAFAVVGVKLELPTSAEAAGQMRDPESGIAIRFTRTWDGQKSRMMNRLETCVGFGNLYADNASVAVASLA